MGRDGGAGGDVVGCMIVFLLCLLGADDNCVQEWHGEDRVIKLPDDDGNGFVVWHSCNVGWYGVPVSLIAISHIEAHSFKVLEHGASGHRDCPASGRDNTGVGIGWGNLAYCHKLGTFIARQANQVRFSEFHGKAFVS